MIGLELISSKDSNSIKEIKKLKERKYRTRSSKFLVEGYRFVEETLNSDYTVESIFVSEDSEEKWNDFIVDIEISNKTKVYLVEKSLFKSISGTETPQGVLGIVQLKQNEVDYSGGVFVLADKIQDPGNMGTIIRSIHACGFNGLITTKGTVDIYNEKTLRSTMGSIFKVPVVEDKDLELIKELKGRGFKLVVSTLEEAVDFYDADIKENIIIAVGNEGNGISKEVLQEADIRVKIPMPGGAESLNAGVAASVMMYEALRVRRIQKIK